MTGDTERNPLNIEITKTDDDGYPLEARVPCGHFPNGLPWYAVCIDCMLEENARRFDILIAESRKGRPNEVQGTGIPPQTPTP